MYGVNKKKQLGQHKTVTKRRAITARGRIEKQNDDIYFVLSLSLSESGLGTWVQIVDEARVSFYANTFERVMNPLISPPPPPC